MDWRDALDKRPDVFAYLDPPYPGIRRRLYDIHGNLDHVALRDYLAARRAPWALSINDLPMTRDLYAGYRFHPLRWRRLISGGNIGMLRELLVTNY